MIGVKNIKVPEAITNQGSPRWLSW